MKKLSIIVALIIAFMPILFLNGCSSNDSSVIEYNVKYYELPAYSTETIQNSISDNTLRFINFKNKNTGTLRSSSSFIDPLTNSYTIKWYSVEFKYTFADESSIIITYNLKNAIFDDETFTGSDKIQSTLILVSKNVIMVGGTSTYYNINYLTKINFGD